MKYDVVSKAPLLEQLKSFYPDTSLSNLKKMIDSGRVYLNGISTTDPRVPTKPKDLVEVAPRSLRLPEGVKILYEDIDLMVVYKPEGLLSVAADKSPHFNLHAILKRYKPTRKITPLHRLDEGTSGILLFSFTDKAKDILKEDFECKRIDRRYCAIVEGVLEQKKGTWTNYLFETASLTVKVGQFDGDGQIAITHYNVVAQNPRYAWIECKLETGRKNQIRVQAAHVRHPIVGDEKYGAFSNPLDRLCLHAYFLGFTHPITRKPMQFLVPPPARFYQLVKAPKERYLLSVQKSLRSPVAPREPRSLTDKVIEKKTDSLIERRSHKLPERFKKEKKRHQDYAKGFEWDQDQPEERHKRPRFNTRPKPRPDDISHEHPGDLFENGENDLSPRSHKKRFSSFGDRSNGRPNRHADERREREPREAGEKSRFAKGPRKTFSKRTPSDEMRKETFPKRFSEQKRSFSERDSDSGKSFGKKSGSKAKPNLKPSWVPKAKPSYKKRHSK